MKEHSRFDHFKEFEKAFREIKSELIMKTNEVTKLKKQLEEVHRENSSLTEALEKLKKASDENKISMDMFMQRSQDFEPKYYEKKNALAKLEIQYKIETSKNNALREGLSKVAMEKSQLMGQFEVSEEKRRRELMYSNEIVERLLQVKNTLGNAKSDMNRLQEEQCQVTTLLQKVDLAEESVRRCQEFSDALMKLKAEKDNLEESYIKCKAKCDKLKSLIYNEGKADIDDNMESTALLTQYTKMSTYYKEQLELRSDTVTTLTINLEKERETNDKLIEEIQYKSKEIDVLEKALGELELKLENLEILEPKRKKLDNNEIMIVKQEKLAPIEIMDSQQ